MIYHVGDRVHVEGTQGDFYGTIVSGIVSPEVGTGEIVREPGEAIDANEGFKVRCEVTGDVRMVLGWLVYVQKA